MSYPFFVNRGVARSRVLGQAQLEQTLCVAACKLFPFRGRERQGIQERFARCVGGKWIIDRVHEAVDSDHLQRTQEGRLAKVTHSM